MINLASPQQKQELGRFVRACRERLNPTDVGLSAGPRRRTAGLRREEAAQLCGLSTTWYTWIEQGRDVSTSPATLARLAVALRLSRAERIYLFQLAGKRDPQTGNYAAEEVAQVLPAAVAAITAPAYVLDRNWTLVCWNVPAQHLFAGWLDRPGEHNLLRFVFLEPAARRLICDWEARARRVAAEFRASCTTYRDDEMLRTLIADLRRESSHFAAFWDQYSVLEREGGARNFNHASDGLVRYEQVTFQLAAHADLRLTMLLEPLPA